jgi:hypothetical protein
VNIIGIEPDSREYDNLTRQYPNQTFHQVALGDRNGEETLYITNHPGKSSMYEPNINLLKKWKYDTKKYDVEKTQKIKTTTLDDFVS